MHKIKKGFEVGKSVHAKWPGSGGYYYVAEIVEFDSEENLYSVKFSNGGDDLHQLTAKEMFVVSKSFFGIYFRHLPIPFCDQIMTIVLTLVNP